MGDSFPALVEVLAVELLHELRIPWQQRELVAFRLFEALDHAGFDDPLSTLASRAFKRCDSPIEELFLAQIVKMTSFEWNVEDEPMVLGYIRVTGEGAQEGEWICVFQQLELTHRVDFALAIGPAITSSLSPCFRRKVVIELDGHNFHERTKEQATRDKARDRQLQEQGFMVLRFTGSEVWANPNGCLKEALRILRAGEGAPP